MSHLVKTTMLLFICASSCVRASAEQKPIAVAVTGQGTTYWDARQDCIRQALQQTLPQLVVADRRIENDKVVRDSVLSTMNGFVDSFQVINQSTVNSQTVIRAEVGISVSGIENFVLTSGKGSAQFDGSTLLGNLSRDDLARKSRSEIIERTFDGFPSRAFDVKVKRIAPDPNERGVVTATIEMQVNKQFLKNLKNVLKVTGRPGDKTNSHHDVDTFCFDRNLDELSSTVGGNCTAVEVEFAQLKQQFLTSDSHVNFLVWFSDSSAPPIFLPSSKLVWFQSNPVPREAGPGSPPFYSLAIVSGGRNGLETSGKFGIAEIVSTFAVRIPKEEIPDGAKEIYFMPLFCDRDGGVLLQLFEPGVSPSSEEFKRYVGDVVHDGNSGRSPDNSLTK
jgi:hypothetical protein